ncbi:tetratricopeptide repeat protein [Mucilaginibacter psychrotolerans]|uniref:Tetratricopeptide repeat protein n=1 Tax=Mucilaginibacter psychrotolerans TaxID=1524096 RepID=A0A4Y8SQX2_9SPHI|nr:tetratricopeptide repeat protein [Mucilaginibacter psychrotolerans]TFF40971.1 tetratricopeptide repeat protein [Mucilaginibacter psychrotolerans]
MKRKPILSKLRSIYTNKTNASAKQLLQQAIELEDQGNTDEAIIIYTEVIKAAPNWATPYYNLGLIYKYRNEWHLSYTNNVKALAIDPDDEAARWNLGIAATALRNWRTARESWNRFGLKLEVNDDEPNLNLSRAPVRLNPDEGGEVVWCMRIDPARAVIENIPFASSGHRYGDIVLNDGAPVGSRVSGGKEYPVFNELQLLIKSNYNTYSTTVYTNEQRHIDKLLVLCENENVQIEDWSTVRLLCRQCSEGKPHEHHDEELKEAHKSEHYIGFASENKQAILNALENWRVISLCEHSELVLEL